MKVKIDGTLEKGYGRILTAKGWKIELNGILFTVLISSDKWKVNPYFFSVSSLLSSNYRRLFHAWPEITGVFLD